MSRDADSRAPDFDPSAYRVGPEEAVDLGRRPSRDDGGLEKAAGKKELRRLSKRLVELQEVLYAQGEHALLVVLQAMDAGGKDSTIRHVFGPVNPQGARVSSFKVPTTLERSRDFLWRVHAQTPARGMIGVFNRSHYEDVLIARVKGLVPEERWRQRYRHIREFERLLVEEGTTVRKFYLHIGRDYQRERFERRLERPDKHWKFNPADLAERARWDDYREAYEVALSRTSTEEAPWYVVPAERRWFRDLLVTRVVVDALEGLDLEYPEPTFDPADITL